MIFCMRLIEKSVIKKTTKWRNQVKELKKLSLIRG